MTTSSEAHRRAALAYQRRHQAAGMCKLCRSPVHKWQRCEQHYAQAVRQQRRRREG